MFYINTSNVIIRFQKIIILYLLHINTQYIIVSQNDYIAKLLIVLFSFMLIQLIKKMLLILNFITLIN